MLPLIRRHQPSTRSTARRCGTVAGLLVVIAAAAMDLDVKGIAADDNAAAGRPAGIAFVRQDGSLEITVDGAYFATYVWNDAKTTRPYFKHLHAPGGTIQLTRNHPPQPSDFDDHETYHPGLWWGFGDVGGNDYWRLKAQIVGGSFIQPPTGGADQGQFAVRNRMLMNGRDTVFCEQDCRYTLRKAPNGILIICETTLKRTEGDFWLGDQEEMGLALRVAKPIAVKSQQGGSIRDSAGRTDLSQVRTHQSSWCSYSGPINGKYAGLLVMNDPSNFRKPWWHAVDTGLLVANPLGESELNGRGKKRENVLVARETEFRLRYGVVAHLHDREQDYDPAEYYQWFLSELAR